MAVLQRAGGGFHSGFLARRQGSSSSLLGSRFPVAAAGFPQLDARRRKIQAEFRAIKADKVVDVDYLPSGEWPENFSMLNFEDLSLHFAPTLFKAEAQPGTQLADVMSRLRFSASQEDLLEAIEHCFAEVSGVPVVDEEFKCVGVVSKKDREKATNGLKSKVSEVMSSPAITLSADKTVSDAAVIMLKKKIHRIPIVNDSNQVIGMVTRTDIFTALEGKTE